MKLLPTSHGKELPNQGVAGNLLDYISVMHSHVLQFVCSNELHKVLLKRNVNEPIASSEREECKQEYADFYEKYKKYLSSEHAFEQKIMQTFELYPNIAEQKWLVALSARKFVLQFENEADLLEWFDFAFPIGEHENREKIREMFGSAIRCSLQCEIAVVNKDTYKLNLSFLFDGEYGCSQLNLHEKVEGLKQIYDKCKSIQSSTVNRNAGLLPLQKTQYFGVDMFFELLNKQNLLSQVKYFDEELDMLIHEYKYSETGHEYKNQIYATIKNNDNRVAYIRYLLQTDGVSKQTPESNEIRVKKGIGYNNFCDYINDFIQSSPHKVLIASEVVLKPGAKDKQGNEFNTPFFTAFSDFENWLSYIFGGTIPDMVQSDLVKYFSNKKCLNFNVSLDLHISPNGTGITDETCYEFVFDVEYDYFDDEAYDGDNTQELFYTCNDLKDCYSIIAQCNVDNDPWSSILYLKYDELDLYSITRVRELTNKKIIYEFDRELHACLESLIELFKDRGDHKNNEEIDTILLDILDNKKWYDFLLQELHDNSIERLQKIIDLRESNDFVIDLYHEFGFSAHEIIMYNKNKDDMSQLKKYYRTLNRLLGYNIRQKHFFGWEEISFSISGEIEKDKIKLYIDFEGNDTDQLIVYKPEVSLELFYAIIQAFTDTSTGIVTTIRWETEDYNTLGFDRYDEDDEFEDEDF